MLCIKISQFTFPVLTPSGQTDCPLYAKAELLADSLQRSLPKFRIQKISILPHEWKVIFYNLLLTYREKTKLKKNK